MQFIHLIEGAYSKESCNYLIDFFETNINFAQPGGAGADISPLYGTGVGVSGLVAGGGGGGGYNAIGVAPGGPGGGGNGEGGGSPTSPTSGNATATDGTANTGGGGGAAASQVGGSIGPSFTIGAGGSGVVIIRYNRQ